VGVTAAVADVLESFASEVGPADAGPVVAVGGRTQWDVGGDVNAGCREVRAPAGVVTHEPAEMTVRVRAGTTVADLDAVLAVHGQCVALPDAPGATVGGVLAVGRSGIRRLGWGPVRDAVLEVRYVSAEGALVKGGGPTVKNVSGFDLPRLFVGSLGTLGIIAEVVLRTRPIPLAEGWFAAPADADPFALRRGLHRPACVLWDGTSTWVLLDGHPDDIDSEAQRFGLTPVERDAVPALPPHRWSLTPGALPAVAGDDLGPFVAEVGVGIVHRTGPQPARPRDPGAAAVAKRVKDLFDPTGRLAPGRSVLA
jgi:glycolate oxidase FAD binding subunit